ncbi:hypothetical protein [Catellatospora sp. NPDC049609]|uniref:hypothetical protein n=1 Tax=Catellatospora sp. NPDC049609 TaxID=3155505 RepID=UPI003426A218
MHIVTVCVPQAIPHDEIASTARLAYRNGAWLNSGARIAEAVPVAAANEMAVHFAHRARRRERKQLLAVDDRMAAGGPVQLLNLAWMHHVGATAAYHRFDIWSRVVWRTPVARPLWWFVDKHVNSRDSRYTLDQAHREFRAQPRVAAMEIYNRSGRGLVHLPLHHLEAFQVGREAYAEIGHALAVPAHAIVDLNGVLHDCRPNEPLSGVWEFITASRHALAGLSAGDRLVALKVA